MTLTLFTLWLNLDHPDQIGPIADDLRDRYGEAELVTAIEIAEKEVSK